MQIRRAHSGDYYCQCETVIAEKMKLFHIPQYYRGIWEFGDKSNGGHRNIENNKKA